MLLFLSPDSTISLNLLEQSYVLRRVNKRERERWFEICQFAEMIIAVLIGRPIIMCSLGLSME